MKKALLAVPLLLMLGACSTQTVTTKTTGIITEKHGCSQLKIVYNLPNNKYGVDTKMIPTFQQCGMYHEGQRVTVFYDDWGIESISTN